MEEFQKVFCNSMNILSIGTAQFGLNYGIKNNFKRLDSVTVNNILDVARENNINTIDTAQGYGDSEIVLGQYLKNNISSDFKIVTKISQSTNIPGIVNDSLVRLNQDKLYGVLIHNFDLYKNDPSIFEELHKLKQEKLIEKIGFSLYYPQELDLLIKNNVDFDIIQVAYSIFDRRFEKYFQLLAEKNVEIHTRSVFLQGLFFLDPTKLAPHFDQIKDKLQSLHSLSYSTDLSISSLCLNFAAVNPFITKIVVGLDSPENLLNNIKILEQKEEVRKQYEKLNQFSVEDLDILFPHFWKLN